MKPTHLLALLTLTALLTGCDNKPAADSTDGQALYEYYCASCHKSSGSGSFLEGIPASRQTAMNEQQLIYAIMYGKAGMPNMPTFGHLSREQARAIAHYVLEELR